MPPLTASTSRQPTPSAKSGLKITGAVTGATVLLSYAFSEMDSVLATILGGAIAGASSALGKEIRDYQHTFEEGGKRAGMVQGGGSEIVLGMLGSWL